MKSQKIKFTNNDGLTLSARLELPIDTKPHAYAIFAHCFTCSKNLKAVGNISRALTQNGIAVLRFDFTGLGQSEGEFSDTNFSSNVSDLISAYEYLKNNHEAPDILIGHSLGGAAVLAASLKLEEVKAVVTIGAPFQPGHVKHLIQDEYDKIEEEGEATVSIGGRPFKIKKQFIEDIEEADFENEIANLNKPLLILHSPQDMIVPIDNAAKIYKAAKHPKSFVTLDKSDHLLSNQEDSLYAGELISSWSKKYIPKPEPPSIDAIKKVAARIGEEGYTTEIEAGIHHLLADEPESVGGNDLGATPYDLLASALGACTSMTLRMYADRKGWDLKEVKTHLQHSKIHSEDCNSCENKPAKLDHIERIIELEGDLSGEQRERLLEIADKCPVHRTLNSEIKIDSKLYEG